jgi:hypothetical protein
MQIQLASQSCCQHLSSLRSGSPLRSIGSLGDLPARKTGGVLGRPRRSAGSRSISQPSDRSTEPACGLGPFGRIRLPSGGTACSLAFRTMSPSTADHCVCLFRCSARLVNAS